MPSMELTAVDSSLFKSALKDQTLSRIDDEGKIELGDDELMCMIDSIGKSSTFHSIF